MVNALSRNNILLICYSFPPYPGIGGRRWAKFAKYLVQNGYQIHVISSKNPFLQTSYYIHDVDSPHIKIYSLKSKYPISLLKSPQKLFQKLLYRFNIIILRLITKGSIYDKSIFWKKNFDVLANDIIKTNKINLIIATGAPFRINYLASQLKIRHPNIKVINDFRDPWSWGELYGFKNLSKKRKAYEDLMEHFTLVHSDKITVPDITMVNYLKYKYQKYSNKIEWLPHAFDKDDFSVTNRSKNQNLLFYGTLYPDLDVRFDSLAFSLSNSTDITLNIYSESERYAIYFKKHNIYHKVIYKKPISPLLLFKELKESAAVIIMQPDNAADYISTKIYEVIYAQCPILFIGKSGVLSNFIVQYNLGICLGYTELNKIPLNIVLKQLTSLVPDFDVSSYSYESVTKNLISIFNKM